VVTTNRATDVTCMSRVRHISCTITDFAQRDLCGTITSKHATGVHQHASAWVRQLVLSNNNTYCILPGRCDLATTNLNVILQQRNVVVYNTSLCLWSRVVYI